MDFSVPVLAPQCKMMNIGGVDIIGNPSSGVIVGLDEEGLSIVNKLRNHLPIHPASLNPNELLLLNTLAESDFFISEGPIKIRSVYFHVTSHCNMHCPGCYSYEDGRNDRNDLSLSDLKNILDNLVRAGLTHLIISGGEPFVRNDLDAFLAYARSIQQICYIECISNGTMPLARYRRALEYLDQLTFSLDSACREKAIIRPDWAFDLVVKKISALKSTKKPVSIVFTLHHKNIDDCDELLAFAHRLDTPCRFSIFTIDSFYGRTSPLTLTESDYRSFHSFITSKQSDIAIDDGSLGNEISCVESCGAGKSTVSVSSSGAVYPCHMFVGMPSFQIGNALCEEIVEIVNNPKRNPFCKMSVADIRTCSDCQVRFVCGGGCRFRAYATGGKIDSIDPMCQIYKANKESYIQRLVASL